MSRSVLIGCIVIAAILYACTAKQPSTPDVLPTNERATRIDAYFSALEYWGFSGGVLVAENNEVILAKGYGQADREAGRSYTSRSVQTTGSITKQFTGAAILKLESENRLSTDDQITTYFDNVPDDKSGITLHQLLTHSAGFPGAIGDDFETVGRDEFVKRAMQAPLLSEPGSTYEYSNVGFSLLAAIVELLSGQSYEQYLRSSLLVPAGAGGVGYLLPAWEDEDAVAGYRDGDRWGTITERAWADDGPYWHLRGNGGLHASPWDMLNWFQVVRGETEVLPADAVERWTTGYVDEGYGDSFYGYGWVVHETPWGEMIAHNGGNMVFAADFFWLKDQDLFFYVASNSSNWRVPQLREEILSVALDPETALPRRPETHVWNGTPTVVVAPGMYTTVAGGQIEVKTDGNRLRLTALGQSALEMLSGGLFDLAWNLDSLNTQAERVVAALQGTDSHPFAGVKVDPERAERSTDGLRDFLKMASQRLGPLESIDVVGTMPGTTLLDIEIEVVATTWVAARFEQDTRVLGMLWDQEGAYQGTTIGPPEDLPSWIFAPIDDGRFVGWMKGSDEGAGALGVEDDGGKVCLVVEAEKACF